MDKASIKKLGALIERVPPLLGKDLEIDLQPVADWIVNTGVKTRLIGHIFEKQPEILTGKLATAQSVAGWMHAQGIEGDNMARILEINPKAFCKPPEEYIEPCMDWLRGLGTTNNLFRQTLVTHFFCFPFRSDGRKPSNNNPRSP